MSMHPVWAALAGLVVLDQVPATHEWIGIGVVALANAVAVITAQGGKGRAAIPRNRGEAPYESPVGSSGIAFSRVRANT